MTKGDNLSEQQQKLLDMLMSGTKWREALTLCGYSAETGRSNILKSPIFRQELASAMESALAMNGPTALVAMEDALADPTEPGTREKVKIATEFLDRAGLGKIERVKHEGDAVSALFILPHKDKEEE